MTQLVQSLLERLSQLPEPMQNNFAQRFLKELEGAEAQPEQQPRKRPSGLGKESLSATMQTIHDDTESSIIPASLPIEFVRKGRLLIAIPKRDVEPLTTAQVEAARRGIEQERSRLAERTSPLRP